MRQVSPSHANYQMQAIDDQSNIKANYEENDRQSPVTSSFTKPLALRRRNRDPYNPTNNNQDYYKSSRAQESSKYYVDVESRSANKLNYNYDEQNIEQENLPRHRLFEENYEGKGEKYYESKEVRSYYRESYMNRDTEEYGRYGRSENPRDRYYNYDAQYSNSNLYQDYSHRGLDRYDAQPEDYRQRDMDSTTYQRSRRNIGYDNYARY